jgi:hypothetical protein
MCIFSATYCAYVVRFIFLNSYLKISYFGMKMIIPPGAERKMAESMTVESCAAPTFAQTKK